MRKSLAITLALALLTFAACAGGPNLPPKAGPEEVELINPQAGQEPMDGFRTIGPIQLRLPLDTSFSEQTMALRRRAAEMGADAVIFESAQRSTQGEVTAGVDREEEIIVRGLAIYYPPAGPGNSGS